MGAGGSARARGAAAHDAAAPGRLSLAFFSTLTALATPRDVMLEQLRIVCFYPADRSTEAAARRLADEPSASRSSTRRD